MARLKYEPAPLLLAFILGPLIEEYLRRTLQISAGDVSVFFTRPISATLLAVTLVLCAFAILPAIRKKRVEVFQDE